MKAFWPYDERIRAMTVESICKIPPTSPRTSKNV
jgi:hypothetical protein